MARPAYRATFSQLAVCANAQPCRRQPGQRVQAGHDQQQCLVAGDQREILQRPAGHRTEQIAGEGHVGRVRISERIREDKVGEEHGREGEPGRDQVAQPRRLEQKRLRRQHVGDRDRREEQQVEQRGPPDRPAPVDEDRHEHAGQDAEERKRVDQPGRTEKQAEAGQAARSEQQEGDPQHKEVHAESANAGTRRASCGEHGEHGTEHHDRQCRQVVRGDERRAQVEEGPIVRRRDGLDAFDRRRSGYRTARRRLPIETRHQRTCREGGSGLAAIHVDQRVVPEGIAQHAGQLGHQPVISVVVVDDEDAVS